MPPAKSFRYDFRAATEDDLPMIGAWLAEPHVAAWWGEPSISMKRLVFVGSIREPPSMGMCS